MQSAQGSKQTLTKKSGKYFWGPPKWYDIHCDAVSATNEELRKKYKERMYNLQFTLPCGACREHYKQNWAKLNIDHYMKDNHSLFLWSYLLHDTVNKSLGKNSPAFNETKRFYFQGMGLDCGECNAKETP